MLGVPLQPIPSAASAFSHHASISGVMPPPLSFKGRSFESFLLGAMATETHSAFSARSGCDGEPNAPPNPFLQQASEVVTSNHIDMERNEDSDQTEAVEDEGSSPPQEQAATSVDAPSIGDGPSQTEMSAIAACPDGKSANPASANDAPASKYDLAAAGEPGPAQSNMACSPGTDQEQPALPMNGSDSLLSALDQLQGQLRAQAGQPGSVQLRLDLHTPELGRVQLHLTLEANKLQLQIRVADDQARQSLEERLASLRERCANLGLELAVAQMEIGPAESDDFGQQRAAEFSADLVQSDNDGLPKLRKMSGQLTSRAASVDLIT